MSVESLRSGPHPHVLPERSGIAVGVGHGLSSVQVAFVIDGDELRSVPRKNVGIGPREANELLAASLTRRSSRSATMRLSRRRSDVLEMVAV